MRKLEILTLFSCFIFLTCTESKNSESNTAAQSPASVNSDTLELEKLTQNLYQWKESSTLVDFEPLQKDKKDTLFSRLDLKLHMERIIELEKTKMFSRPFIENYDKIGLTLDEKLRNKSLVYPIGELSPYGTDADPWCNCQDSPEKYWSKIKIRNPTINGDSATYFWTWGGDFKYKVNAIKERGMWKVSYLEGFDYKNFISEN
jgi:hypothetical protein